VPVPPEKLTINKDVATLTEIRRSLMDPRSGSVTHCPDIGTEGLAGEQVPPIFRPEIVRVKP